MYAYLGTSVVVDKNGDSHIDVKFYTYPTQIEAEGAVAQDIYMRYPISKGYKNHSLKVTRLSNDLITTLYDRVILGK